MTEDLQARFERFERFDEHGMLLGITEVDDFIEELDSDDGLLGHLRPCSFASWLPAVAKSSAELSEISTTGHVIAARRWTIPDDALNSCTLEDAVHVLGRRVPVGEV